jgi:hypothetical protein
LRRSRHKPRDDPGVTMKTGGLWSRTERVCGSNDGVDR